MLSDDIKSITLDCGFHAVGIASAERFTESEKILSDNIDSGFLDGTGICRNKIEQMISPQASSLNAISIITVALSYLTDDLFDFDLKIARFSVGTDYHIVMRRKLDQLSVRLRDEVGINVIKTCVDTNSVSDRSAAIRSGMGCQGKNGCVYISDFGSWVVLGELIAADYISSDKFSAKDICGDCRKCIDACPTGAIIAPAVIDTRKCLSQATQCKGSIDPVLRRKLGVRVYGCDTCQDVCPLNKSVKRGNLLEFRSNFPQGFGIRYLMNITRTDYNNLIRSMTAGWIGLRRIRRNAIIAAGNSGNHDFIDDLKILAIDNDPFISEHAIWALKQLSDSE